MLKTLLLGICCVFALTAYDAHANSAADMLREIAGVWTDEAQAASTITVMPGKDRIRIATQIPFTELTFIDGRIGEVSPRQGTINLYLDKRSPEGIMTLRQKWNQAHTEFNLLMILEDGTNIPFSFVREVSPGLFSR